MILARECLITMVTTFSVMCGATETLTGSKRYELQAILLNESRYDKGLVPGMVKDPQTETEVFAQIVLHNVYSVDVIRMEYSVDVLLKQTWIDERLDFTGLSDIDKLELDNAHVEKIWLPDTIFDNEKRGDFHEVSKPNRLAHIWKNGSVFHSVRLSLTLSCALELHDFPFDVQICPMAIHSYGLTSTVIDYKWRDSYPVYMETVLLPQYLIEVSPNLSRKMTVVEGFGELVFLKVELVLTRKTGSYVIKIFLPSIMIVTLSWASFWLDVTSTASRTSIGVVTVHTMTTFSYGVRVKLPSVSYVMAVDIWLLVCQIFVFLGVLEYMLVHVVARGQRRKTLIQESLNQTSSEESPTNDMSGSHAVEPTMHRKFSLCFWNSTEESKNIYGDTYVPLVDKVARVVFPVLFGLFLIIFLAVYSTA